MKNDHSLCRLLSRSGKKTRLDGTSWNTLHASPQFDVLDASAALWSPIVIHPNEKVSKPLFAGHSILTQRISLAHELGRSYLENTSDYLASVHSPLED
jgi:hypothetical protein